MDVSAFFEAFAEKNVRFCGRYRHPWLRGISTSVYKKFTLQNRP